MTGLNVMLVAVCSLYPKLFTQETSTMIIQKNSLRLLPIFKQAIV